MEVFEHSSALGRQSRSERIERNKTMNRLLIILPITITSFSSEAQTSKVELENGTVLTFDCTSSSTEQRRRLILKSGDRKETVWESNQPEPVVVNGYQEKVSYGQVKLAGASVENGMIATAFELTPGWHKSVPAHALDPYFPGGIIPVARSKRDLLIRVFIRKGGVWSPQLSFYPQTFFGDTVDEPIEEIIINDINSIDIRPSFKNEVQSICLYT